MDIINKIEDMKTINKIIDNKDEEIKIKSELEAVIDKYTEELDVRNALKKEQIEKLSKRLKEICNKREHCYVTDIFKELDFSEDDLKAALKIWKEIQLKWISELQEKIEYMNKGVMIHEVNHINVPYLHLDSTDKCGAYCQFLSELKGYSTENIDKRVKKLIERYKDEIKRFEERYPAKLIHLGNAWWIKTERDCGFDTDEIIEIEEKRETYIIRELREHEYLEDIKLRYEKLESNKDLIQLMELLKLVPEFENLKSKMITHGMLKDESAKADSCNRFNML